MRHLRYLCTSLVVAGLLVGCAAAPRYQLPATETQLQTSVTAAEEAYKDLYRDFRAQRLSKELMARVDALYETWQTTQQWLTNAVRSGAVTLKAEEGK